MRRVVLLGASGVFGQRLAERLARWPELELVLAARRRAPLDSLCARLQAAGATATLKVALADRTRPTEIVALAPWAVIDAAGPFLDADYRLARAVAEAGAHWIDLADGRRFVAGFAEDLQAAALAGGVMAVTGASSTPALTWAALEADTAGWRRVDEAATIIAPEAHTN